MVQIPRQYSTRLPSVQSPLAIPNPGFMRREGEAMARSGEEIIRGGEQLDDALRRIEEAGEIERMMNINHSLKDDFRELGESFREDRNYEGYNDKMMKGLDAIRNKYEGSIKGRGMRMTFNQVFGGMESKMKDVITAKKAEVITENAIAAFTRTHDEALYDYIHTDDEVMRTIAKSNVALEAGILVAANIMKPADMDKVMSEFDARADESKVRMIGVNDPHRAYEMLMDKESLTSLDPIKRASLTEHMEVRMRMEGSRIDKLSNAIQRENQAAAINDWANGKLDIEKLKEYRENDVETGRPGLSDSFFVSMYEKLRSGGDVETDQEVFKDLYLDDDLTRDKIDEMSDRLSVNDTRTLLNRVLQERREEIAESRSLRREAEAETRREAVEERAEKRMEKERRGKYAADARSFMKKAFNEFGIGAKEGIEMLRVFQGYVDDNKIPSEELADYAMKVIEARRGGVIKRLWDMYKGKTSLEDLRKEQVLGKAEMGEEVRAEEEMSIPTTGAIGDRRIRVDHGRGKEIRGPGGTWVDERVMMIEVDGKWYNVPTVVEGKQLSKIDVMKRFKEGKIAATSGPHGNIEEAERSAERRKMIRDIRGVRPSLDELFGGSSRNR